MMTSTRIKSVRRTRSSLWISATTLLAGWIRTRRQQRKNMRRNRKNWRKCAPQSSPSCTKEKVVLQEECQEVCLVVCQVVWAEMHHHQAVVAVDQPLRRLIKTNKRNNRNTGTNKRNNRNTGNDDMKRKKKGESNMDLSKNIQIKSYMNMHTVKKNHNRHYDI